MNNHAFPLKTITSIFLLVFMICFLHKAGHAGEGKFSGVVIEAGSGAPVPFANLALFNISDSRLIGGTTATEEGQFSFSYQEKDAFLLRISSLGYVSDTLIILPDERKEAFIQVILQPYASDLQGVIISADHIKARTEGGNTIYMVNKAMLRAAHRTEDLIGMIPGVFQDIHKQLSYFGSGKIVFLVNGEERDQDFIKQIMAERIERLVVSENLTPRYDQDAALVIDIILKDLPGAVFGHLHAEIPSRLNQTYSFPSASLHYSKSSFGAFVSYNGSMSHFRLTENLSRFFGDVRPDLELKENIDQRTWSHRFNAGLDYSISKSGKLSIYGFVNPFSDQHGGRSFLWQGKERELIWIADKTEKDLNLSGYYSIRYRHIIDSDANRYLTAEFHNHLLDTDNLTTFYGKSADSLINYTKASARLYTSRLSYSHAFSNSMLMLAGIQHRLQRINNHNGMQKGIGNHYTAIFAEGSIRKEKIHLQLGLRAESFLPNEPTNGMFSPKLEVMPSLLLAYMPVRGHSIRVSYRHTFDHPAQFQLNAQPIQINPISTLQGNPLLIPQIVQQTKAEYSRQLEKAFVSFQTFHYNRKNAIGQKAEPGKDGSLSSTFYNQGSIRQTGARISGQLGLGRSAGLNASASGFRVNALTDGKSDLVSFTNRTAWHYDLALSVYANFGSGFGMLASYQQAAPVFELQRTQSQDALYLISVSKEFRSGIKGSIVSMMPLSNGYAYQKFEVMGNDFVEKHSGIIQLSAFPLIFSLRYVFPAGSNRQTAHQTDYQLEKVRTRGL